MVVSLPAVGLALVLGAIVATTGWIAAVESRRRRQLTDQRHQIIAGRLGLAWTRRHGYRGTVNGRAVRASPGRASDVIPRHVVEVSPVDATIRPTPILEGWMRRAEAVRVGSTLLWAFEGPFDADDVGRRIGVLVETADVLDTGRPSDALRSRFLELATPADLERATARAPDRPLLLLAAAHADPALRLVAAGRLGDVPALGRLARDPGCPEAVRSSALDALATVDQEAAVDSAARLLRTPLPGLLRAALAVIEHAGAVHRVRGDLPRAAELMAHQYAVADPQTRASIRATHTDLADILDQCPPGEAVDAGLTAIASTGGALGRRAADSLARRGTLAAVERLSELAATVRGAHAQVLADAIAAIQARAGTGPAGSLAVSAIDPTAGGLSPVEDG